MFSENRSAAQPTLISSSSKIEEPERQGLKKLPESETAVTNSADIAIRVQNLSKCYQIYDTPRDRLKQFVVPRLQCLLGQQPKQYFREFWALRDVSFEVKRGETVGIVGRNGSGKSTLLQLICGTLAPTEGSIEATGRIAALLELGSGFNPEFTGRENVYMNGAVLGLNREEIDERFDAIASFADIGEFIDQPVKTYSSGMFVRLAFAIQANISPDILIVDEALAVGDAYFVHRCMLRFRELQEQGKTILLVSHDATSIKNLCQRAIWLESGCLRRKGNSSSVIDDYLAYLFGRPIVGSAKVDKHPDDNHPAGFFITDNSKQKLIETVIPNIDRRLGNQVCSIVGVGLYDETMRPIATICNGNTIILRITISNNSLEENSSLVVGYVFRNGKGQEIASTNSAIEGGRISSCIAGNVITVAMQIALPLLHPGTYAFSPTVGYLANDGDIKLADRIEHAVVLQITSNIKINVLMNFQTLITQEF